MAPTLGPSQDVLTTKNQSSKSNPAPQSEQSSSSNTSTPTRNPSESSIQDADTSMASGPHEEDSSTSNNFGPISNLLQVSLAASGTAVQVPADVLATLLTSLEDLKKEVKLLQHTTATQTTRVAALESEIGIAIGMRFTPFPKLPFEIRQIIWKLALEVPRIVALKRMFDDTKKEAFFSPVAPYSPLLWVSREFRHEAQNASSFLEERCQIRTNPSTDIVWLLPRNDWPSKNPDDHCHTWFSELESMANSCKTSIPTLALDFGFHTKAGNDFPLSDSIEMMKFLRDLHTNEVIFVIGEKKLAQRPDVVLIDPTNTPNNLLPHHWLQKIDDHYWLFGSCDFNDMTWDVLADCHRSSLSADVESVTLERLDFMNAHPGEDHDEEGLEDFGSWTVPRFRFMEVTTREALRKETGSRDCAYDYEC